MTDPDAPRAPRVQIRSKTASIIVFDGVTIRVPDTFIKVGQTLPIKVRDAGTAQLTALSPDAYALDLRHGPRIYRAVLDADRQPHSTMGPAIATYSVVKGEGHPPVSEEWWVHGSKHRHGGMPAVTIKRYGYQAWYDMGVLHRADGPAVMRSLSSGRHIRPQVEYWYAGVELTPAEYAEKTGLPVTAHAPVARSEIFIAPISRSFGGGWQDARRKGGLIHRNSPSRAQG